MRPMIGIATALVAISIFHFAAPAGAGPANAWINVTGRHLDDLFGRRLHFEGGHVTIDRDGHLVGRRGPGALHGHWKAASGAFCPRIEGRDAAAPEGCDVWRVEAACLSSAPGAPCSLRIVSKATMGQPGDDWGWAGGLGFILP
ncbi:MAG: hypothetical protein D6688_12025 [Alphaproteobacteria bacterium]|nr:MAG: hypothetical protein D6688_12025 [Alphaproteobacteria bacterium]